MRDLSMTKGLKADDRASEKLVETSMLGFLQTRIHERCSTLCLGVSVWIPTHVILSSSMRFIFGMLKMTEYKIKVQTRY